MSSTPVLRDRAELSAATFAARLAERLQETRQQLIHTRWLTVAGCAGLVAIVTIALVALVDYFFELPFGPRAVGCAGLVAAIAGGLHWAHRRWILPLTLSKAAAKTEERVGEFGQRLRTTLDYHQGQPTPAEASPQLLTAMHGQTARVARQVDWEGIVDGRPAVLSFAIAAMAFLCVMIALIRVPEYRTAMARAMLLPAEYTHVDYVPHEQAVKFGDSVEVEVTIEGRPVCTAIVRYRPADSADGDWTTIDLANPNQTEATGNDSKDQRNAVALVGHFAAKIADLQHDLDLEVLAGPRPLPAGHITVLKPLTIEHASAQIVPPPYTGRSGETAESLDLKVLEGSDVEIRLELNRPAAEGALVSAAAAARDKTDQEGIGAPAAPVSLVVSGNRLTGSLKDLRQSASYTVTAKAADGISLDPAPLRIRVQVDQKPDVKFLAPPEELTVILTTEVPVVVQASDDLGLYKVGIQYRVDDGELCTLWEGSGNGTTDPLQGANLLLLEDLNVTFRNAVSYYAFAEDNYFGEARRTTTELRFIDIRPFKIDYQVVDSEGGSCCGSVSLEELIHLQRQNLRAAFVARQERSNLREQSEKLRRGEAALEEQTREFVEGVEAQIGPVPTLDVAVALMGEAVKQLSQQAIDSAAGSEQQALASLMQARENLRQILKNPKSQQASNCRKFDREFRQKLRLPKPKDTVEEKLAQIRKQLDDLAERERKWGRQAQQCCSSSGSSTSQTHAQSNASENSVEPQTEPTPSADELAKGQEELRQELDRQRQQLAALKDAGDAAQEQAEQADRTMQLANHELQSRKGDDAANAADNSAKKLDELADHLAALAARDFGQRMDEAHRQAQQIAEQQTRLASELAEAKPNEPASKSRSKSGESDGAQGSKATELSNRSSAELVREQESLATRMALLGELLERLRSDAGGESATIQDKLDGTLSNTPPSQIAKAMRQAAHDLEGDRQRQAAQGAAQARDEANELAKTLGIVRGELAQPRLEELLRLEEQLAQLVQQAQRAQEAKLNQQAELAQKWQALAEKLGRLAEADRRLAAALDRMQAHANGGELMPQGHYSWLEMGDFHGAREVAKALQTKIQEAILAGTMVDSDQPIPAEYKPLVEKYYKTLSDDLR
jgi:hypothetical protein